MKLVEIEPTRLAQSAPGLTTRWFRGSDRDLFVWQKRDGGVVAFQFTVGAEILVWSKEEGTRTGLVDDGEVGRPEVQKMAPIIQPDAAIDAARLDRLRLALAPAVAGLDVASELLAVFV